MTARRTRPLGAALVLVSLVSCDDAPPAPAPTASAAPSAAPTTQALELPGIRIAAPIDYVPMEDTPIGPRAIGKHELKALRASGGAHLGMMRVERHSVDATGSARTARAALDRLLEAAKQAMLEEGVAVKGEVETRGNTLFYCTTSATPQTTAPFQRCSAVYVDENHQIISLVAFCSVRQDAVCEAALGSIQIDAQNALALDAKLPGPDYGTTRSFSAPGMTLDIPSSLEPLPEADLTSYRQALNPDGSRPVDVAIMRSKPGAPTVVVEVQKAASTGKLDRSVKVKDLLESEATRLSASFQRPGLTIVRSSTTPKDDGIEVCAVTLFNEKGEIVETHLCAMLYMATDYRGIFTSVRCSAEKEWAADVCGPIVASRKLAADKRMKLDDMVPPTR